MLLKSKRSYHTQGFTLIEMLINLFVTSLILFSLLSCVKIYQTSYQVFESDYTIEWYQFLERLKLEISRYELVEVENKCIKIKEKPPLDKQFNIIHRNGKIYKESGHHPYLYGVKDWDLIYHSPILFVTVTFDNGQQFYNQIIIEERVQLNEE